MEPGDGARELGQPIPDPPGGDRGAGRSCGAGRRARELGSRSPIHLGGRRGAGPELWSWATGAGTGQPIPDPPGGGRWGATTGRHHATSHERHAPPCRNSSGVSFIALRDTYFSYTFSPDKRYCAARARARWFAATRDLVSLHVFFMNFIHAEAPHSPLRACANILNAK